MKSLSVAMFSDSYLPRLSGVVHAVASFSGALRAAGHRVLIIAPSSPGYTDTDPDVLRLPSIVRRATPDFPIGLPYRRGLLRHLQTQGIDVVHAHSPFLAGALALRTARSLGCPLLFTHHTLYHEYIHYVPGVPRRAARKAVLWYTRAFANRCDAVIVGSRTVEEMLRGQGVIAPLEVLPTAGVDVDAFARLNGSGARRRFGIPDDAALLVTVSRLAPEKSLDLVLEAFRQVVAARRAYLLIVGGGPAAESLRAHAERLVLDARAVFSGPLPHLEALEVMAAADVFVFASQTETQGLVLVEAMAAGVPVAAVARGGVVDVVRDGETGVLVEPDATALAGAVISLLDDHPRRDAMGARAREVAGEYAVPVLAGRLAGLYEVMIERRVTRHREVLSEH